MPFKVYVLPQANKEIDRLPGYVRHRVRRAVIGLRDDPKPVASVRLKSDLGLGRELWRLRIDTWRVVYLIDQEGGGIYVLAVRKRPPYQYEDLASLLTAVEH
jgi:mRNA interferase RelE/StbE